MKVGEVWILREHVKAPVNDQININYTDHHQHYSLVPAIVITSITKNIVHNTEGWDGLYLIGYDMVFGIAQKEPYVVKSDSFMSSGCLFRNYEKFLESLDNIHSDIALKVLTEKS